MLNTVFSECVIVGKEKYVHTPAGARRSICRDPEPGFSIVSADKKELTLRMIDKKGNILHTVTRKK